ncbi:MAG: PTS glucose transporter subunit IIA [Clostridia bacterium]|nr:PTS glucose transporter subunit IIA [Clostridia bacterium]
MGLFQNFRKTTKEKQRAAVSAAACLTGTVIPMEKIPDPAFSEGILGPCAGIDPPADAKECSLSAPLDGVVTQCSETGHAVGITCGETELLLHAGIDTVEMAGDGFSLQVKPGDPVEKGQILLVMDAEKVRAAGHPAMVITIITETGGTVSFSGKTEIQAGETLFTITAP